MLLLVMLLRPLDPGRQTTAPLSLNRAQLIWVPDSRPAARGGGSAPSQRQQPIAASVPIPASQPPSVLIEPPIIAAEPEPLIAAATVTPTSVAAADDGRSRVGSSDGDTAGGGSGPDSGPGNGGVVYGVGNGVSSPVPVRRPPPAYTPDAMRARLQGVVVLNCVVQTDGTCADIRVMRSLDAVMGLDQQAIASAREWRFRPGVRMGEPVPVRVTLEIAFNIR
jgi:periplasmic protein TonB